MPLVRLVISVAAESVAALLETLQGSALADTVQVSLADDTSEGMSSAVSNGRPARRPQVSATTSGRETGATLYAMARRITPQAIQNMAIPDQQRRVLAYIVANGPQTFHAIIRGTRIKEKSVSGAIFKLRHHRPPLIVSQAPSE